MRKKICLISSSGGHYEQLMMLKPLSGKNDCFVVTERTSYNTNNSNLPTYFLYQVNRKELKVITRMIFNLMLSLKIFIKERPDIVISTGALVTIPMCLISKIFGKKLIYIESFAKINTPTLSGKLMYKFADQFYVQWESMLEIYPNAIYKGGIY